VLSIFKGFIGLLFRDSTDPDPTGLEHNEASNQGLPALFYQCDHVFTESLSHRYGVSYEYHPMRLLTVSIHELTEIPVLCQDNSLCASCKGDHFGVLCAGRHFRDGMHVIAGGS